MDKLRLAHAVMLALVAALFQGVPPTRAETAATPFDGDWSNEYVRCTPAMNWRAPGMEVRDGKFRRSSQFAQQYFTCDVSINPDGSFAKACGNGTSIAGRVVDDRMTYDLKHPYALCEVAFRRIARDVGPSLAAAPAVQAATVTICAQTIDNPLRHQRDPLPPEQQALWGIWDGEVVFHSTNRRCVGWLFGRIDEHGEPTAIHAYNTASSGLFNNARMGANPWPGGRYRNGTLVMTGPQESFELRKVNADTLEGSYIEAGHNYPATFKRRKPSN